MSTRGEGIKPDSKDGDDDEVEILMTASSRDFSESPGKTLEDSYHSNKYNEGNFAK